MRFSRGDTTVRWLSGGLHVSHGDRALLVDAPAGVEAQLPEPALDAVLVTSGRIRSVGGLLALFAHLEPHRRGRSLTVHALLGEERVFAVSEVWTRHWPDGFPIDLDARRPGTFDHPPFLLTTTELVGGERSGGGVAQVPVLGVRLRTPDLSVAVVPSARPGTVVERLCHGVDLAVLAVGREDWPATAVPFRTTAAAAATLTAAARTVWLVGDDGAWLGAED